jgi:serine/threonine protein kinase
LVEVVEEEDRRMQRDGGTPPAPRPDGKGKGGGGLESAEQAINDLEDVIPVNQGRLAAYEVGKQIGSGKFSVVFRARAPDGKNVALKKIQIFDIMDAKSRNKCLREVRMLQTISQHVNLVEYLDAFIENNELHIVFEWAENGDLKRLLRKVMRAVHPAPQAAQYIHHIPN